MQGEDSTETILAETNHSLANLETSLPTHSEAACLPAIIVWMEFIYIIDRSCCYLILLDRGSITKSMQESERGMREMLFCGNRDWVNLEARS